MDHARPIMPAPHTLDAAVRYIRRHTGIDLEMAVDGFAGNLLGRYLLHDLVEAVEARRRR